MDQHKSNNNDVNNDADANKVKTPWAKKPFIKVRSGPS
jgi:hypothetical protein